MIQQLKSDYFAQLLNLLLATDEERFETLDLQQLIKEFVHHKWPKIVLQQNPSDLIPALVVAHIVLLVADGLQ